MCCQMENSAVCYVKSPVAIRKRCNAFCSCQFMNCASAEAHKRCQRFNTIIQLPYAP